MKTFEVRIKVKEVRSTYVEVDATDWEEAEKLVESMYYKGEIEFDPRDDHSEFLEIEVEDEVE